MVDYVGTGVNVATAGISYVFSSLFAGEPSDYRHGPHTVGDVGIHLNALTQAVTEVFTRAVNPDPARRAQALGLLYFDCVNGNDIAGLESWHTHEVLRRCLLHGGPVSVSGLVCDCDPNTALRRILAACAIGCSDTAPIGQAWDGAGTRGAAMARALTRRAGGVLVDAAEAWRGTGYPDPIRASRIVRLTGAIRCPGPDHAVEFVGRAETTLLPHGYTRGEILGVYGVDVGSVSQSESVAPELVIRGYRASGNRDKVAEIIDEYLGDYLQSRRGDILSGSWRDGMRTVTGPAVPAPPGFVVSPARAPWVDAPWAGTESTPARVVRMVRDGRLPWRDAWRGSDLEAGVNPPPASVAAVGGGLGARPFGGAPNGRVDARHANPGVGLEGGGSVGRLDTPPPAAGATDGRVAQLALAAAAAVFLAKVV